MRRLLVAIVLTLSANAQPSALPPRTWLPLEDALAKSRAEGRLVLLHVMAKTRADADAGTWIDEALTHESIAHSADDMVLARVMWGDPAIDRYDEVARIAQKRTPHLLVLDPAGGVVLETMAFRNVGLVAAALSSLRSQAPAFLDSARLRLSQQLPASYFRRAMGLAAAGAGERAHEAFEISEHWAAREGDPLMQQRAQLGRAALDLDDQKRSFDGYRRMEEIARRPLAADIGADAWLLLGDYHARRRNPQKAMDAYSAGYRLAKPGSLLSQSARHSLERMGASPPDAGPAKSAAAGSVRLIFPRRTVMAGPLDVVATAPAATARIEFLLDDARVTESYRAPYRATLELGATPRLHTLRAVAYDDHDRRIGEEGVTVNDRVERLSVEITSPQADAIESEAAVEVTPRLPEGEVLDGVDVYWNETRLATLTAAPFRTSLTLPSRHAFGYLRAVVRVRSGASAEDAKLINPTAKVEDVRVDAVELYAVVQDRSGKNVEGLTKADFVVKEDGHPVEVALRGSSGDPITVGLALDTSGSMQAAMMDVAEAAMTFLRGSLTVGDRTFVVAFDEQPHLVQPLTGDLMHIGSQIFDAPARGATAVWDSIAFSIQQLKGVAGKRALVVFTDGLDNGSRATPAGVRSLAREAGVPVYVVLMHTGAYSIDARTVLPAYQREYQRLADESGGAFFNLPKRDDLPRLFAQIRDDTRGEYILTFVSKSTRPRGEPRSLLVEVPKVRGTIRAPTTYLPR
jgi:VWFA-related protein